MNAILLARYLKSKKKYLNQSLVIWYIDVGQMIRKTDLLLVEFH